MTPTSNARIRRFVDAFIRDERLCPAFGSSSDDWIADEDRMARCSDAAEDGADGSTHREVINDWRDHFDAFQRERERRRPFAADSRFAAGVREYFDHLEQWHETNGSADQEIG